MLTEESSEQSADSSSGEDSTEVWPKDHRYGSQRNSNVARNLKTRPNASDGFYLCSLLPLAFTSQYFNSQGLTSLNSSRATPQHYDILCVAAWGLCTQSLCFFVYLTQATAVHLKLLISLLPAVLTSGLYIYWLNLSWQFGLFWGFILTFSYQKLYIKIMHGLPFCFSVGEASVLVQGLVLFLFNAMQRLPITFGLRGEIASDFDTLNTIMLSALCCLFVACCLLAQMKYLRTPSAFYATMVVLLLSVTCLPITQPLPVVALLQFITKDTHRLYIIAFYILLTAATVGAVSYQLRHDTQKASTRMRKIFHLLILLVYVPGLLYQCDLLYIASGVAFAIFTVLELFRVLQIPPLGDVLRLAFATFSDEKDAGMLALTPFCLLIGCSLPLWINPCPCACSQDTMIPLMAGLLTVGVGDAAASIVGSKYGVTKWRGSSRSLEGTLAYILSICLALCCLISVNLLPVTQYQVVGLALATVASAIVEAYTDQIDNLVLPLIFYIINNATS